jgi:ABC-2 type transport system permease protein
MLKSLKKYWSVYLDFFSTSYSVSTSFRTSFVLIIFLDLFFYLSVLYSVELMFNHVELIADLSKNQFLFFLSYMLALDQLHMIFVSPNFWELSEKIKTGNFDYTLIRPLHSLFTSFFREVRVSSFVNTPLLIFFLYKYGSASGLTWISWLMLPFLLLLSFLLLIILEFIISCLMFWTTEGNGINFLRMQFQTVARWPETIYAPGIRLFFTIALPFLVIGSTPVAILLEPARWYLIFKILILIILFWFILLWVWNKALLKYNSASS